VPSNQSVVDGQTVRSCVFGPITVDFDDRVLTPRAWTLGQSTWAAELARDRGTAGCMLELCAGAGHIGLAAAVLADWDLVQVELDPVAAAYAAANARRAGWGERVRVRNVSLREALEPGERFALIVADPPYLASAATARWPEDPLLAIDGGPDGLTVVRDCLQIAAQHLDEAGTMVLQVAGPAQVEAMAEALGATGLRAVEQRVTDPERAVVRIERA